MAKNEYVMLNSLHKKYMPFEREEYFCVAREVGGQKERSGQAKL